MTLHVKSPIFRTTAEYEGCATWNAPRGVSSFHVLVRAFGDAYMRRENVRHATFFVCAGSDGLGNEARGEKKGKSMKTTFAIVAALCAASFATAAGADDIETGGRDVYASATTPLAVSLAPGFGVPDEDWNICGIRLNIFAGKHHDISFLDVGTIANLAAGEANGLQLAGVYNQADSCGGALQIAGVANRCDNGFVGIQSALVNAAGTVAGGLQIGVFNRTESLTGLQIGVVNYTHEAVGLQIGLLNVIADSPCAIMPIVNIGF